MSCNKVRVAESGNRHTSRTDSSLFCPHIHNLKEHTNGSGVHNLEMKYVHEKQLYLDNKTDVVKNQF